jgi:hypothetical protein
MIQNGPNMVEEGSSGASLCAYKFSYVDAMKSLGFMIQI